MAAGRGTVTALLHGYRSSQSDPGVWEEVPPRLVTVADLPAVDLTDALGFVATPAYLGVPVTGVPQETEGVAAGSFPQSFVDYLDQLGAAAFWYSSGSATDAFKPALPLSVSYDATAPVVAPSRPSSPQTTSRPTWPSRRPWRRRRAGRSPPPRTPRRCPRPSSHLRPLPWRPPWQPLLRYWHARRPRSA